MILYMILAELNIVTRPVINYILYSICNFITFTIFLRNMCLVLQCM